MMITDYKRSWKLIIEISHPYGTGAGRVGKS